MPRPVGEIDGWVRDRDEMRSTRAGAGQDTGNGESPGCYERASKQRSGMEHRSVIHIYFQFWESLQLVVGRGGMWCGGLVSTDRVVWAVDRRAPSTYCVTLAMYRGLFVWIRGGGRDSFTNYLVYFRFVVGGIDAVYNLWLWVNVLWQTNLLKC